MSPEEIKQAREIIDAATPGPWKHDWGNADVEVSYPNRKEIVTRGEDDNYNANLEFIAAAREGWPKALDEIERFQNLETQFYLKHEAIKLEINLLHKEFGQKQDCWHYEMRLLESENKKLRAVADAAKRLIKHEWFALTQESISLEAHARNLDEALKTLEKE